MFGKQQRRSQLDRVVDLRTAQSVEVKSEVDIRIQGKLDFILENIEGDERPYLKVDVLGKKFLGLLDTGASRCVVGTEGIDRFRKLGLKLVPSKINSCSVADGKVCEVMGCYEVPFVLEHRAKIIKVLALPELPHLLVLGIDFFRLMGIVPDFRHNYWTFAASPSQPQIATLTDNSQLRTPQSEQLNNLIGEVFSDMPEILGCTTMVKHDIKTKAAPIRQRYYPISPALQVHVNKELDEMLRQGIVEPSSSPWSSPIVMVKKKDGSYRFCVDFRKLNKVTERDSYPLPNITHTLDKLRDARYLTSLDIKSAYWQVPLTEEAKPLTAFVVPGRGLFQFRRMPMGLHNSSATWQRFVDSILGVGLEPYVFVYLDDIIIVTQDFEKHLEILREVFRRLREAGLTVSKSKCHFCRNELKYLGYVIDEEGLHVDPDKVSAILNLPIPKNIREVRRVLGMTSWYRRFIPNFATVVAPINNLLRKNSKFLWTDSCTAAFEKLKEFLVTAPVMNCPDFSRQFSIQTDASDYGLGAVLVQEYSDGERAISYISRSLNKNERKFSATEKECLAVLWAIEKFRPYVEATHFKVITDHFALKWLNTITDPSGRLARWSVKLQQYDFDVIHRRGKDNVVPDALSRAVPVVDEMVTTTDIFSDTKDPWYHKMRKVVASDPLNYPLWRLQGGNLLKKIPDRTIMGNSNAGWKLVVPKDHRRRILSTNHDLPTAGHCGIYKTYHRILRQYFWPKMKCDIAHYIRNCQVCLEQKPEQKAPAGHLSGRPEVAKPWETISIDLVGPLPKSPSGHIYILSISDYFSKFCIFQPLRTATATTITKILEDHVFLLFGVPRRLIIDNGKQFIGKVFEKLTAAYGIEVIRTPSYHPQGNPCERQHRTLGTMLRAYVKDNHRTWEPNLQKVACAIRTAKHESTGQSPYFINFGREMKIHGNDHKVSDILSDVDAKGGTVEFARLFEDVRTRLDKAFERSRTTYNLRHRNVKYEIGDRVWRKNYPQSDAGQYFTAKFAPKFLGPFVISKRVSPWAYELKNLDGRPAGTWNVKDLKPDTSTPL